MNRKRHFLLLLPGAMGVVITGCTSAPPSQPATLAAAPMPTARANTMLSPAVPAPGAPAPPPPPAAVNVPVADPPAPANAVTHNPTAMQMVDAAAADMNKARTPVAFAQIRTFLRGLRPGIEGQMIVNLLIEAASARERVLQSAGTPAEGGNNLAFNTLLDRAREMAQRHPGAFGWVDQRPPSEQESFGQTWNREHGRR